MPGGPAGVEAVGRGEGLLFAYFLIPGISILDIHQIFLILENDKELGYKFTYQSVIIIIIFKM